MPISHSRYTAIAIASSNLWGKINRKEVPTDSDFIDAGAARYAAFSWAYDGGLFNGYTYYPTTGWELPSGVRIEMTPTMVRRVIGSKKAQRIVHIWQHSQPRLAPVYTGRIPASQANNLNLEEEIRIRRWASNKARKMGVKGIIGISFDWE